MRNWVLGCTVGVIIAGLAAAVTTAGQNQGPLVVPDLKDTPIAKFIGEWAGESTAAVRGGGEETATVHERAQWKLGGAALLVEGRGTMRDPETGDETVVHDALGVIRYDAATQSLRMHAFRADHPPVESPIEVLDNGDLRWGFEPAPGHTMRFTITLTDDTWVEVGEYSPDGGTTWMQVLEMDLFRIANE